MLSEEEAKKSQEKYQKNLQGKPEIIQEAGRAQKGYFWPLELLIFVAVFLVVQLSQFVILMPGQIVMIFTNPEYNAAMAAGDIVESIKITMEIAKSDGYIILTLFSTGMMILLVCLFCRLLQKRKLRTLGFCKKNAWKEYLKGLAAGFVAFSVAVLLGVVTGGLKFEGLSPTFSLGLFLLYLVGFLIQGMAEEVLCRGYFLVSMSRRYPVVAAIIANSLFFAALHLANDGLSVLAIVNLALFGVFASLYFLKRGNIWGIGAFHSIWNLVQGNFYGIRVSGIETSCTLFSTTPVAGRDLLNGGAFGLEGSIWVTVVFVVGILILYPPKCWSNMKRGEANAEETKMGNHGNRTDRPSIL